MRIFIRVVYALLIGFGLFVVFSFTDAHYRREAVTALGQEALDDNDYSFFIGTKYYNETPIINELVTENNRTFKIMVFEVARYYKENEVVKTKSGLAFIIHQIDGVQLPSRLYGNMFAEGGIERSYSIIGFGHLPIYTVVNHNTNTPVVEIEDFIKQGIYHKFEKLEVAFGIDSAVTLSYNFSVELTDLIIADQMKTYYDENEELPTNSFSNVTVSNNVIDTFNPVVWLWVSLYVVFVIAGTVLVMIYSKYKKMGKKELTPGLELDLEKQQNKEV